MNKINYSLVTGIKVWGFGETMLHAVKPQGSRRKLNITHTQFHPSNQGTHWPSASFALQNLVRGWPSVDLNHLFTRRTLRTQFLLKQDGTGWIVNRTEIVNWYWSLPDMNCISSLGIIFPTCGCNDVRMYIWPKGILQHCTLRWPNTASCCRARHYVGGWNGWVANQTESWNNTKTRTCTSSRT